VPLAQLLADFKASVMQCESLIANAHQINAGGVPVLPLLDRKQITVAAFLNLRIAWEAFLEASLAELMVGEPTLSGTVPVKFVSPIDLDTARMVVIGINRYFDYGNHDHMIKTVRLFFQAGYPYEPHLSSISSDLSDIRTMRNASAHITSTTQKALDALAQRILGKPWPNIELYSLLTALDPKSTTGDTIFVSYKNKLVVAAELIAQG
jgi:hypothetical protein